MSNENVIEKIRDFLIGEQEKGKKLTIYQFNVANYAFNLNISVKLEANKEIILQEDTKLELGGENKQSFSIVHCIEDLTVVKDNQISLLGPEIDEISESRVDFGIFILIGIEENCEEKIELFKNLGFISNSIEGFMIRTIPRRFWCRISSKVVKKNFSFQFLGNAIIALYREKFENLIKSLEIFFISSYSDSVEAFIKLFSGIARRQNERWKRKIQEWKKRIDCEYEWTCQTCPYQLSCLEIKKIELLRKNME
jgi:CO dehydrogenase/acetyl-CoA synthase beta subunit